MSFDKTVWILLGLFIQYQVLAADKPVSADAASADGEKEELENSDGTKTIQDEDSHFTADASHAFDIGDISGLKDSEEAKRGFGRWKNFKWSQGGSKRNIGRWKNRKWRDMQSYGMLSRNGDDYGHSLNKRFSEDGPESDVSSYVFPDYGFLNVPTPYEYYDYYDEDVDNMPHNDVVDKRHMSRWNLIHRKLADLNSERKRDGDEEKRMGSRWRIIHNKLNQLHSGLSKRSVGRWKNQNWLLRQGFQRDDTPLRDTLQKRFVGKWKNYKWLGQRYGNA